MKKEKSWFEKVEEGIQSEKESLKKKDPWIYLIILTILTISSFFAGNFFENSSFIQGINPFTQIFGATDVEITRHSNLIVKENSTEIFFDIKNNGDKEIKQPHIIYSFCGLGQEKVDLDKTRLDIGEKEDFSMEIPIKLNTGCSVSTKTVNMEVYESNQGKCYLDIKDQNSKVCKYCKVEFEVYGNDKIIRQINLSYPYLDEEINVGAMARYTFVKFPVQLTPKEGNKVSCEVLHPNSSKESLLKKESIGVTFYDIDTLCTRGDDIEWCKTNYYTKI